MLEKSKRAKENVSENHSHNVLRFFDIDQMFLSPLVKQRVIIRNKHVINKSPNDLQNVSA